MLALAPSALAASLVLYMFLLAALSHWRGLDPLKNGGRSPQVGYLIIAFNSALMLRATGPRQVVALLKKYLTIESAVSMPKWSVTAFRECMASR
jgi:hypothetical protein